MNRLEHEVVFLSGQLRTQELSGTLVLEQIISACLFVLAFSLSNSNSRSRRCDEGPVVGLAQ